MPCNKAGSGVGFYHYNRVLKDNIIKGAIFMKKILSIILSLCVILSLCASLCVTSFAEEIVGTEEDTDFLITEIKVGITSVGGTVVDSNGNPITNTHSFDKGVETVIEAKPEGNAEFKYWIEKNTNKIISDQTALTLSGMVGRSLMAVFSDPDGTDRFVTFYGKDGKTLLGSGDVKEGKNPGEVKPGSIIPENIKAYVSGYTFKGWTLKGSEEVLVTPEDLGTEETEYYAYHKKNEELGSYLLTVNGGTVITGDYVSGEQVPYGTRLAVKAGAPEENQQFLHWTQGTGDDEKIVSYAEVFNFMMPSQSVTLTAKYGSVAEEEKVTINMIVNNNEADGGESDGVKTKIAGFLVTRYVPEGVEVVETGIIYVRDADYGNLTIDSVGKTAPNGKTVNVVLSEIKQSGQHKFNARYEVTTGMKAIAFVSYRVGNEIVTDYSAELIVPKAANQ